MFRAPTASSLLAVHVGTGVQLISMAVVTMLFAVLGFLSPANRGGLMTAVLLLFVFMGVFAGYSSARLYKTFKVGPKGQASALLGPAPDLLHFICSCGGSMVPQECLPAQPRSALAAGISSRYQQVLMGCGARNTRWPQAVALQLHAACMLLRACGHHACCTHVLRQA